MNDFKNVAIAEIRPDPAQPRKFFDKGSLDELTESVKKDGVLEPIMIRPNGKGYIIVYGERRFRAATAAGLKEIPAQVRELTPDEAFEFQITENLHRKDVHPMEEANSYERLQKKDSVKNTIKELATRFAKSEGYVAQRLSFNNLIPEFQKAFYEGQFVTGCAVLLSRLTKDDQYTVKKDNGNCVFESVNDLDERIDRHIMQRLDKATFKQDDADIYPAAGPCTTCMKRSGSNQLLFPDIKAKDRCFDKKCFDKKTSVAFTGALKNIIETKPEIHLVQSRHRDSNKEAVAYAKEMKIKVLSDENDFSDSNYGSFKKKAQGFWLNGWSQGEIKTIYLKGSATVDKNGKKVAAPEKPAKVQIAEIQEREKRAKELDDNKIWIQIRPQFRDTKLYQSVGFAREERNAIAKTILNALDFTIRDSFRKFFSYKENNGDVEIDTLNQMLRFFFLNMLPPTEISYGYKSNRDAQLCVEVAKLFFGKTYKQVEDSQKEIAEKRAARVKKRIADLQPKSKTVKKK